MTRRSKRELEREVRDLSDQGGDADGGIVFVSEHGDGTLTDLDGDALPDGTVENASLVITYPRESEGTDT